MLKHIFYRMKWKRNSEKLENNMKETIPKCANQLNPSQCPTKIIQMTIRLKCIMVSIDSKLLNTLIYKIFHIPVIKLGN